MGNRLLKTLGFVFVGLVALAFGAAGACGVLYSGASLWAMISGGSGEQDHGVAILAFSVPAAVVGLLVAVYLIRRIRDRHGENPDE
jgi:hypothetical protein